MSGEDTVRRCEVFEPLLRDEVLFWIYWLRQLEHLFFPKTTLEASGEDVKTTLETSGEDLKTTLETSGEDAKPEFFAWQRRVFLKQLFDGYTEWQHVWVETTLETSGKDVKLHSKRVEKMWKYTRNEWRRCENTLETSVEFIYRLASL
jgi:hypothetical protein